MLRDCTYAFRPNQPQLLSDANMFDTWVLLAVEEGSFWYRIGDCEGMATEGSIVACPAGVRFHCSALAPVSFHFFRLYQADGYTPPFLPGLLRIADHARLASNLTCLKQLHTGREDKSSKWLIRHVCTDLIYLCIGGESGSGCELMLPEDPIMDDAADYIRRRAHDPGFRLSEAAGRAGLHPTQFSRQFRSAYQLAPSRYLSYCRLKLAKKLLAETDFTLEKVALRCGYENGYYLSRVFKQATGLNPSAFRETAGCSS